MSWLTGSAHAPARRAAARSWSGGTGRVSQQQLARLTQREREIAELIVRGLSNKEIASSLHIEVPTVKNHVHHILEKLGVTGRGQAAAHLRLLG